MKLGKLVIEHPDLGWPIVLIGLNTSRVLDGNKLERHDVYVLLGDDEFYLCSIKDDDLMAFAKEPFFIGFLTGLGVCCPELKKLNPNAFGKQATFTIVELGEVDTFPETRIDAIRL